MDNRVRKLPAKRERCYDSADLDLFRQVLRNILQKLRADGSLLAAPDRIALTKVRVAVAIFHVADSGIRNQPRLEELAASRLDSFGEGPQRHFLASSHSTLH